MKKLFLLLVLLTGFANPQSLNVDHKIMSESGFVEFLPGNLPIIISVPHDGDKSPDIIPDRTCSGKQTKSDIYTMELGNEIRKAFYRKTGKFPFLIINHLKRRKVDVNREINEAACGNKISEQVWDEYHNFIDSAKEMVYNQFKRGLYIDLHAHGHTAQFLELGYLLDAEELQLSDKDLDDALFIEKSSIRNLAGKHPRKNRFIDIIRGPNSLGTLLEDAGYPAIPSQKHPGPEIDQPFFRGGYSLYRHGSVAGGTIDGIQMETNFKLVRDSKDNIKKFSDAFTLILAKYAAYHYAYPIAEKHSEIER